jgi:transposase InsO family protein
LGDAKVDRDCIFVSHLDESIGRLGVKVLKSPPHSPMANAISERVIGTIRRECLDWLIPLSASHLRSILKSWVSRHRMCEEVAVRANSVLGGLHRSSGTE